MSEGRIETWQAEVKKKRKRLVVCEGQEGLHKAHKRHGRAARERGACGVSGDERASQQRTRELTLAQEETTRLRTTCTYQETSSLSAHSMYIDAHRWFA